MLVDGVGEGRARAVREGLLPPGRVEHPRALRLTRRTSRLPSGSPPLAALPVLHERVNRVVRRGGRR